MSSESNRLDDDVSLWASLLGDGRFLIALTGVALIGSGGFALFLSITGHILPHDVARLGMDAKQLQRIGNRELVNFMFHDRTAFGGSLISIGVLYLWLVEYPLKRGEPWAWWTLVISGASGFGSFLTYLGYGYLDTWHGVATLFLLPIFVAGMVQSRNRLDQPRDWRVLLRPPQLPSAPRSFKIGKALLFLYGLGLAGAGPTIMTVGMTSVFVPDDLAYIRLSRLEICGIADPLVPIIAHDRSGFGGGLFSIGLTVLLLVLHATPSRSFRQAMWLAGLAGFSTAIGVHFVIGYTILTHLAPAIAGAVIFIFGMYLTRLPHSKSKPIVSSVDAPELKP